MYEVICADVLEWTESYDGPKFHAVLCDAPYHLTTITKRFGKEGSAQAKYGNDGAFQRVSGGFMGQEWDGSMVSFQPETWAAIGQHLYSGAFLMTFAGSRTFHRIACAIEDAGYIIHPAVAHIQGQGFPKSTRIKDNDNFEGHRYGLQALKPCMEFVCVAQLPYDGRPVDCITGTGAGALWIEGGRIGTIDKLQKLHGSFSFSGSGGANETGKRIEFTDPGQGRWPANVTLGHHAECTDDCHPECPIRQLDEEVGIRQSPAPYKKRYSGMQNNYIGGTCEQGYQSKEYGDKGGPSRFYFNSDWSYEIAERLANLPLPMKYCPKAGRKERDAGLDQMPMQTRHRVNSGGLENEPRWAPIEMRNSHPTVKPIKLTTWLATLLLPPPEYAPRRILVPFSGSGSEMIGCLLARWEEVIGIELSQDYCAIAEARLAHWSAQPQQRKLL